MSMNMELNTNYSPTEKAVRRSGRWRAHKKKMETKEFKKEHFKGKKCVKVLKKISKG
jgi:hypothetical protein